MKIFKSILNFLFIVFMLNICLSAQGTKKANPYIQSTCGGLFPIDFGKGLEGELFANVNIGFFIFHEYANRIHLSKIDQPTPNALSSYKGMKYRLGTWWCADKNRIYKWDKFKKTWQIKSIQNVEFNQFEVLHGEDILLINSRELESYQTRTWLELCDGGGAPKPLFDWPKEEKPIDPYWAALALGNTKTISLGEYLLIYSPSTGKLFLFDSVDRQVKNIALPFIETPKSTSRGLASEPNQSLPRCVQFLPTPGRAAIVIWDEGSIFTAEDEAAYIKELKATGKPLPRESKWKASRLDLVSREFQSLEVPNGLAPPFWSRDGWKLEPLDTIIAAKSARGVDQPEPKKGVAGPSKAKEITPVPANAGKGKIQAPN